MTKARELPQRTLRPDEDEVEPCEGDLHERGLALAEFLRACLRWYNADPERALAALQPVWPEPRPKGRPPADDGRVSSEDATGPD